MSDQDLIALLRLAADKLEGKTAPEKKESRQEKAYRITEEKLRKQKLRKEANRR